MSKTKQLLIVSALVAAVTAAGASFVGAEVTKQAAEGMIGKEQAIELALAEHPGDVTKAYKEKKRGKDVWEVKIKGDDGKKWEVYYDAETGALVKAESEDD